MKKNGNGATRVERLYYRAREVAQLTGLGLRTIYTGIYDGSIPSRKIGNSRLIPADWLRASADRADEIRVAFVGRPRGQPPKNR